MMENMSVLEMLSELEQFFFYQKNIARHKGEEDEEYKIVLDLWQNMRHSLEKFHELTGLYLTD